MADILETNLNFKEIPFAERPVVLPSVSGKSKGKEAIIVCTTVQHSSSYTTSSAAKLPISLLRVVVLQNMSVVNSDTTPVRPVVMPVRKVG